MRLIGLIDTSAPLLNWKHAFAVLGSQPACTPARVAGRLTPRSTEECGAQCGRRGNLRRPGEGQPDHAARRDPPAVAVPDRAHDLRRPGSHRPGPGHYAE